jgi:nucleoside phosphorylase/uncharacterized SAM-dependent methyltransferase
MQPESTSAHSDKEEMKADIAIITIREDEFKAVRERFQTTRLQMPSGRTCLIGEITTDDPYHYHYTIAIARAIGQGNDASQRLAHDIIQDLDPQLLLVVGIAGGIPHNEFTLGDVIVSTHIVNSNVDAKNADGTTDYMMAGNSPHPHVEHIISLLPGDPQLNSWNKFPALQLERPDVNLQQMTIHGGEEWQQRVQESLTQHFGQESNRHRPPLFKTGPIISSNHLMKDPLILMDLLKMYRSVLAVEMEAAGVYEAARRSNNLYPVMVIRGISDIVGLQRDEKWTAYACQTAAAFTSTFIMTAPIGPRRTWGGYSPAPSLDRLTKDPKGQKETSGTPKILTQPSERSKMTEPLKDLSKIENAINNARLGWTLCFIGEDQATKLATLTQDLRGRVSKTGDGKQIASGFSYWGISPAISWTLACNDPFYLVMRESIEAFTDRWMHIVPHLDSPKYHYVSLGVGTGHKDGDILKDLYRRYPHLYYLPVDMSPEMLRIGVQEAIKGTPLERRKILPIQLDFSTRRNVDACRSLLDRIVEEEPILFSLLGNTLANFEQEAALLKTLTELLRPQDRLLLEVAYTEDLDEGSAQEAAEEYSKSRPFREFVTSALLQNTDLRMKSKDISFLGSVEPDRALRIKALYQNKTDATIEITLPDRTIVDFPPEDTIRLYLSRKYTSNGIKALLANCGLSVLKKERSVFDPTRSRFDFGIELMLLAPSKA